MALFLHNCIVAVNIDIVPIDVVVWNVAMLWNFAVFLFLHYVSQYTSSSPTGIFQNHSVYISLSNAVARQKCIPAGAIRHPWQHIKWFGFSISKTIMAKRDPFKTQLYHKNQYQYKRIIIVQSLDFHHWTSHITVSKNVVFKSSVLNYDYTCTMLLVLLCLALIINSSCQKIIFSFRQ